MEQIENKKMKKKLPSKLPKFKSDEEIAAFMETHNSFDLVDTGLAEIVPTPFFVRKEASRKAILKDKRIQVAFKDERSLRRTFSFLSSSLTFFVIDADFSGILLGLPDKSISESFYVPYLNISAIKIVDNSTSKASLMRSKAKLAQNQIA
jgi:hypothetical protein